MWALKMKRQAEEQYSGKNSWIEVKGNIVFIKERKGVYVAFFTTKNKCYKPRKPDFVSTLSFICDCNYLQPVAAYPGSSGGPPCWRAFTWHYSTQGLPALHITVQSCELLPPIFTLMVPLKAKPQLFSVALSLAGLIRQPAIHRWVALCCPDFPSR